MDLSQIEQLKERLIHQRLELQQLAGTFEEQALTLDPSRCGRLSRVEALQAKEMAQETIRRRRQQLAKIEAALRRIDAGDYGMCLVCGEDIDVRRLAADPTNTRCIGCAQAADRGRH